MMVRMFFRWLSFSEFSFFRPCNEFMMMGLLLLFWLGSVFLFYCSGLGIIYLNLFNFISLAMEIFEHSFRDWMSAMMFFSSHSSWFPRISRINPPNLSFIFSHFLINNSIFSVLFIYVKHASCNIQYPISFSILSPYLLPKTCSGFTNKWCTYMTGNPFKVKKILSKVKPPSTMKPASLILMDNYKSQRKQSHSS